MNKTEFIEKLSKVLCTTKAEAGRNFDAVTKCISESLKEHDEVRFIGFGTFKAKNTPEKRVRTPRGAMATVPAQRRVSFSSGTELKETVNSK